MSICRRLISAAGDAYRYFAHATATEIPHFCRRRRTRPVDRRRVVIGTVHLAKAVVSAAASISFLLYVGATEGAAVFGLIVGGVVAAPFGAVLARHLPARVATLLAATAVLGLGLGLDHVVKTFH